jgi:hypothetical protein
VARMGLESTDPKVLVRRSHSPSAAIRHPEKRSLMIGDMYGDAIALKAETVVVAVVRP